MDRRCNICGTPVPYEIVNEYPKEVIARAASLGIPVEDHVARSLSHVSYAIVQYAPHDGPCGKPCNGYARGSLGPNVHDGTRCPCNEVDG